MTDGDKLQESRANGVRLLTDPTARAFGVALAFSDRDGGVSGPPYASLNLALRVGDRRNSVEENRRRVAQAAGFDLDELALARQIHGADVLHVEPGRSGVVGIGDGLVAGAPGVVLGILSADCAPVLVAGGGRIGVLHAGWRGLLAGVVERGLDALGDVDAAWVGPCIRACCYEVGAEVIEGFESRGLAVAAPSRVDVADAAATVLQRAGVASVSLAGTCTGCDHRYFSHRREGKTGRQGAFIRLLDPERDP